MISSVGLDGVSRNTQRVGFESAFFHSSRLVPSTNSKLILSELLREASATRRRAEDLAVQRGHLSMRRLRRLQGHLRFRSLRRSDKAYARLVLELGWVDPAALEQALEDQKLRFATQRDMAMCGLVVLWTRAGW